MVIQMLRMLSLLAMLCTVPAQALVEAELDRNQITPGDTVRLTITMENNDAEPALEDLEANFEILQRQQVSKTQIINGRATRQRQRIVLLAPKQQGTILIPPIRAGSEQSQPLRLVVQPSPATAGDDRDAFIEVQLSRERVYLRAELVVTVRAWYRGNVDGNLTSPAIDNALVEQLGEQQTGTQIRNGLRYNVVERRYLVFPQQAGTLEIPSLTLSGLQSLQGRTLGLSPFGPSGGRRIHVRSQAQQVDVLPVPDSWPADEPWLPASDLQLTEHWSEDLQQLTAGQAVTRSIRLRAAGQSSSALPPLGLEWPAGLKVYPDQPELEQQVTAAGIAGTRVESTALIPMEPGPLQFAPIELRWWDTDTDTLRVEQIPARTANVKVASRRPGEPAQTTTGAIKAVPPGSTSPPQAGIWPWIAAGCLLGWILTALAWLATRRSHAPAARSRPGSMDVAPLKALRSACAAHDARAARVALLRWARLITGRSSASLGELLATLASPELLREGQRLEQHLYGQGAATGWDGKALLQAVDAVSTRRPRKNSQNQQDLPSLYPS